MASIFPGMDPFIEGDSWQDFHLAFIAAAREFLVPRLRPHYLVRAQERVYVDHLPNGELRSYAPDISVVTERGTTAGGVGTATAIAPAPTILTVPMPVRQREHYLTIFLRETMEVVTILELLSPANKRRASDGQRKYLAKRETVLLSESHLVEIDLLRGGERLPSIQPLPPADYYAFVCRATRRPCVEVYAWPLPQSMPSIPIPLANGDPDAALDLQAVFTAVYDRSDYDYSLDYNRPLSPPIADTDAAWVKEVLASSITH